MFGGFTFLWFFTRPLLNVKWLITLFLIATALGATIELLQGLLSFLGRSMEFMDAVADSTGALLGIGLFCLLAYVTRKKDVLK